MPRIDTKVTTVYTIDELSAKARAYALDKEREHVEFDAECSIDDAKNIGALMGIEIERVLYSGFSSQGDGACFEGSYAYAKGAARKVLEHAPQDKELHRIAHGLHTLQRRSFYGLSAAIVHRGYYVHEGCTDVAVYDAHRNDDTLADGVEEELTELLRDFMCWIYRQLENEYEYQHADEQILESLDGVEFTETGRAY